MSMTALRRRENIQNQLFTARCSAIEPCANAENTAGLAAQIIARLSPLAHRVAKKSTAIAAACASCAKALMSA